MPHHYKLTYFNERARGEPIRLIFVYAGVPFEDNRLTEKEFYSRKESKFLASLDKTTSLTYFLAFPNGQLPILEVDGELLSQSGAITRFVARKFGLGGHDDWEVWLSFE